MLEKLAAVSGVSNLHVYAAMRGETLEEFLATRNTQVIYSVAGNDAGRKLGPVAPAAR
jgi:gallate dioxygenase